ncbi:hypothetical protein ACTTAI_09115 [Rhodobacter capsulatus]|uniref:hypothetical protein n=1 Tax=Rhodobacter capsulatus TaxID=1061 RepID=UPI0040267AA2
MTYVLPMSVTAPMRGRRPLQMQFAAPFLGAEACEVEAEPVILHRSRPVARAADRGVPFGPAVVGAISLGLLIGSGALYWGVA